MWSVNSIRGGCDSRSFAAFQRSAAEMVGFVGKTSCGVPAGSVVALASAGESGEPGVGAASSAGETGEQADAAIAMQQSATPRLPRMPVNRTASLYESTSRCEEGSRRHREPLASGVVQQSGCSRDRSQSGGSVPLWATMLMARRSVGTSDSAGCAATEVRAPTACTT